MDVGVRASIDGVVDATAGTVTLGDDSVVSGATAIGDIAMDEKATVTGDAIATGSILREHGTKIGGKVLAGATVTSNAVTWSVDVPTASSGDEILVEGQQRDLAPGSYHTLVVPRTATVTLHSGSYRFENFDVHAGGTVLVDNGDGPIQAIATSSFYFRGSVGTANLGTPNILFGYLGADPIKLEVPFAGQMVAPNSSVTVAACNEDDRDDEHHCHRYDGDDGKKVENSDRKSALGHDSTLENRQGEDKDRDHDAPKKRACSNASFEGSVHAKSVSVGAGVQAGGNGFDWGSVVGAAFVPSTEGKQPVQMMGSSPFAPIHVKFSSAGDQTGVTTVDFGSRRRFRLKNEHEVSAGTIANGTVDFRFSTAGGPTVTCTYRGGASNSAPLDYTGLNLGRVLRFASCSDHHPFDWQREATHAELIVHPAPGYKVAVTAPVTADGACSEEFPLVTLEQAAQLRQNFDWKTQTKLAEKNPDGSPTLFYAWVYVKSAKEALALRQLFIHVLHHPLFREELDQFAGKCGAFTNPGDGEGAFVPAVLPGATFNKLIDAQTSKDITGDRTVFDVIRIRDIPAAARNGNGSIRLDLLANSGFRYLDYETGLAPPDQITRDSSRTITRALVDVVTWVVEAVQTVIRESQIALATAAAAFVGRVGLTLEIHAVINDSLFVDPALSVAPPMIRGWGDRAGHELGAVGMRVSLLQRIGLLPFPTLSQGTTDADGRTFIDAVRDAGPYESGICLQMETNAARVTDFLSASDICDFRGFGVTPNLPDNGSNFQLKDFSKAQEFHIHADLPRMTGLYEADDDWLWSHDVVKYRASKARILSGFWAETFSPSSNGTDTLFTPCLGYLDVTQGLVSIAALPGGLLTEAGLALDAPITGVVLGVLYTVLSSADIVMSTSSSVPWDRTVMSHEYGHYLFCSLLNDFTPGTMASPVEYIATEVLTHPGISKDVSQSVTYINEAMADFFDGQVTGGANYTWAAAIPGFEPGGLGNTVGSYLCTNSIEILPPIGGLPPPSQGQCFDNNISGNATSSTDRTAIGRTVSVIEDVFDGHNDRFGSTPGDGDVWVHRPGSINPPVSISPTSYGISDSSYERVALNGTDLTIFAGTLGQGMGPFGTGAGLKDSTFYGALNSTMSARGFNWCERCRVFGLHSTAVKNQVLGGTVTPGDLFQACSSDVLLSNVLGPNPISDGNFNWNSCLPCPAGQFSDANGNCTPCDLDRVVGNRCVSCPPDQIRNGLGFVTEQFPTTVSTALNDPCPDIFILEIDNPSDALGPAATGINASLVASSSAVCQQNFTLVPERTTGSAYTHEPSVSGAGAWNCGFGGCTCSGTPTVDFDGPTLVNSSGIRIAINAAQGLDMLVSVDTQPGGPK
jgi:hypothetical protein